MEIIVRGFREEDIPAMTRIWNEVVEDGIAFPQEEALTEETGAAISATQATQWPPPAAGTGSAESLCATALIKRAVWASGSCSSMPLWRPIHTRGGCMRGWALSSSA